MYTRRTANPINVAEGGEFHPTKFGQSMLNSTGRLNGILTVFPTITPFNNLYGFVRKPVYIPGTSLPLITPIFHGIVKDDGE